ncbi:MAG TPA: glycoside hydrolase family 3 C-terminal domain-containing protein, partial [Candidatus Acidoferrales bacterium]|nr:glycoside hydrolase family 3 C-terminal domain-containing protein [Candidatus Acidoferrales bacterium]
HGVRYGMATSFPVSIGMAATWDIDLIRDVGVALGQEFRGKGFHQMLGPSMDICRDPRYGRSPESGGEDSYLCARITTSLIKGAQSTGCIATAKHYNANGKENNRTNNDVSISQRMLMEEYGLNFRTAVQEGGVMCVMNAYNLINGQKCAENPNLLTNILRTQWGFPFYVVSDWGSIWNTANAVNAGCTIDMGDTQYQDNLMNDINGGSVSVSTIDDAVRDELKTKALAGMLDYYLPGNSSDVNSTEHQQLCLQAGRESLVLLKNRDNILPLDKDSVRTIAVIGPSASVCQTDASGSSWVTPFYSVSPLQGIENKIGSSKVVYAKGCDINSTDTSGFAGAISAAQSADYVIYVGGLDGTQEGEGFDRASGSIDLPGEQEALVNRLSAVNKSLICVIESGGVCGIDGCIQSMKGLIYGFYPGQEGGNAIADVIFGDYNPGGKLPVTMPRSDSQLPPYTLSYDNEYGAGYRWFDQMGYTPEFAFGFGLSYTSFNYGSLTITPTSVAEGQNVTVSVDVSNTGSRSGDEVVELYLSHVSSTGLWMPVKQLRGFKRVSLDSGQTKTITFTLTSDEFYYYDTTSSSYEVDPGTYTVKVGGSSDNLPLTGDFDILSAPPKPDFVITNFKWFPRFPVQGDNVVFLAMVKNQGTGPSPADAPLKVDFSVNGIEVSHAIRFKGSIPAGGMALICADTGINAGTNSWRADQVGTFAVKANVNADNSIDELIPDDNICEDTVVVISKPPINIALYKTATASSIESSSYPPSYAVDGNSSTRWSSQFSDPQWIKVDLGAVYNIDQVSLSWEAAYAKEFEILISRDDTSWEVAQHVTNGTGGLNTLPISMQARYVEMYGIQRATQWGYSLYEFDVYASDTTAAVEGSLHVPDRYSLDDNFPNPFNPTTMIGYQLPVKSRVSLDVYDVLGRKVAGLVDDEENAGYYKVNFDGSKLSSGVYFCRLTAGNYASVKKMVMVK